MSNAKVYQLLYPPKILYYSDKNGEAVVPKTVHDIEIYLTEWNYTTNLVITKLVTLIRIFLPLIICLEVRQFFESCPNQHEEHLISIPPMTNLVRFAVVFMFGRWGNGET